MQLPAPILFAMRRKFIAPLRAIDPRAIDRSSHAMMLHARALIRARRGYANENFFLFDENCACNDLRND